MSANNNSLPPGILARVTLGFYLILVGAIVLIGVALPPWVAAVLAIAAGVFVLLGRY